MAKMDTKRATIPVADAIGCCGLPMRPRGTPGDL